MGTFKDISALQLGYISATTNGILQSEGHGTSRLRLLEQQM